MKVVLTVCLCLIALSMNAQNSIKADSLNTVKDDSLIVQSRDTVLLKSYATRYDPRKALLYAAVLPGLGQIYNKKYWKLPLVYGGVIFIAHYINIYQIGYTSYKSQLFDALNGTISKSLPQYTTVDQLRNIVDRYRRERDYMIILMGGMYLLQIIDAHVDAHLKEFDLNPNLHVRVEPMMRYESLIGRQNGFSILIRF